MTEKDVEQICDIITDLFQEKADDPNYPDFTITDEDLQITFQEVEWSRCGDTDITDKTIWISFKEILEKFKEAQERQDVQSN